MLEYALRRLLLVVPTLFGITLVTFAVIHLAPGDPAGLQSLGQEGGAPSVGEYERLRAHFGLDEPIYVQYWKWLESAVTLDFGRSFYDQRPVWKKIRERLPWTISLSVAALGIGFALSVPIGVYSAVRRGGGFDRLTAGLLFALYSVPNYVAAVVLMSLVVTVFRFDWLPIRGAYSPDFDQLTLPGKLWDLGKHFVLITLCYVYPSLAFQARFVRSNLLEVLEQDFVRTARAKGLDERGVVVRHALRNTMIPLLTFVGLVFPTVLAGSVILEVMFGWPGMGELFFSAMLQRDYPTVMGLSVLTAMFVLMGMVLTDLSYAWADPRIRYGSRGR